MFDKEKFKIIGFDLDQTLYPKSPVIDEEIQRYVHYKISEFRKCSIEEAKTLFYSYYPGISGRKTLIKLGFPEEIAGNVVQEALEKADIAKFLIPNPQVLKLLQDLKLKYQKIALITGSEINIVRKKLESLKLPLDLFYLVITGEISKSDGTAYKQWLDKHTELKNYNFLYIGDRRTIDADVPLSLGIQSILVNVKEEENDLDIPQLKNLFELRQLLL